MMNDSFASLLCSKLCRYNAITTISWVSAKVSFAIFWSALLCLRGARTSRRRNLDVKDRDLEIEKGQAELNSYSYFIIGMYIEIFFFLVYR